MQSSPRKSAGLLLSAGLSATVGLAAAICTPALGLAEECPGHPDALGTSRVLVVDPSKIQRVGVMQYPQSLPLADKEVVLTFDDGPLPPHSTAVLDTLAAQCVKATFFLVGEMAREFPSIVRRIHEDGHTIGTHSEHHPLRMHKMPIDKVRAEIDRGIADVGGALWDQKDLAPFFRIPGLARSDAIEKELADRSLVVFSSDTVADDWHRRIRSADIVRLAVSRLEARGRGILLLHDIHRTTADALPELLGKLKAAGFHVVHIVPGTEQPEVAGTVPAGQAGSSSVANVPTPAAQPTTAEAANAQGATAPEPNTAAQPAAGVSDSRQAKVESDAPAATPAPNADNVPHDNNAGAAPEADHQIVAANAPPAAPNEAAQPAPAPLYNQATSADRAATREADGAKQEATDGPSNGNQVIAAIAPPAEQNAQAQPAPASSSAMQAASAPLASPQQSDASAPASESLAIAEPAPASEEPGSDADDPVWPRPVISSIAEERAELPVPDERALSADYHPWRTVKLADGSQTAVHLALDAVPQWTDPPTALPAGSGETQLPAPAVPYYFGGGEIETSIAE
jgi:peptidoglycan/xylan/chitin deacetylase (PgdA/CDA1 family)